MALRGDGGKCLQQIVPQVGIFWFPKFRKPFTIFGDNAWRDYTVEADVLINGGIVELGGRFENQEKLGYRWAVGRDGSWWLYFQDRLLAGGVIYTDRRLEPPWPGGFNAGRWHRLKLSMAGRHIRGFLNGQLLADIEDSSRAAGVACLASTYHPNCFDNVSVQPVAAVAAEDWPQLKYDARHSGNVPGRKLTVPLGPGGRGGAGRRHVHRARGRRRPGLRGRRLRHGLLPGRRNAPRAVEACRPAAASGNCNNVSSPALAGRYLHFGTMAGVYYVLDAANGKIVREIACGEPIFSTPVVGNDRVYFATLGSRVYALTPDGEICWTWDFVKEQLGFARRPLERRRVGRHLKGRVTNAEQFLCSRDMALDGRTLVIPAGGAVVWLEDTGQRPPPGAGCTSSTRPPSA